MNKFQNQKNLKLKYKLDNLEKFISTNGCDFYGLIYNEEYITLKKNPWIVPEKYGNFVPLLAGKELAFEIKYLDQ